MGMSDGGKIRAVSRDLTLRAPRVNPKGLEQVQEALMADRLLEIEYRSLQDPNPVWRTVNARALLLEGSVPVVLSDFNLQK